MLTLTAAVYLFLQAMKLVVFARLALWVLPLDSVRRLLRAPRASVRLSEVSIKKIVWAVQAAARRVPGASCLTQALALQALLARAGKTAQVHIGAAKDPQRGFLSHAWVEYRGEIILGDNGELERYRPMLALHQ